MAPEPVEVELLCPYLGPALARSLRSGILCDFVRLRSPDRRKEYTISQPLARFYISDNLKIIYMLEAWILDGCNQCESAAVSDGDSSAAFALPQTPPPSRLVNCTLEARRHCHNEGTLSQSRPVLTTVFLVLRTSLPEAAIARWKNMGIKIIEVKNYAAPATLAEVAWSVLMATIDRAPLRLPDSSITVASPKSPMSDTLGGKKISENAVDSGTGPGPATDLSPLLGSPGGTPPRDGIAVPQTHGYFEQSRAWADFMVKENLTAGEIIEEETIEIFPTTRGGRGFESRRRHFTIVRNPVGLRWASVGIIGTNTLGSHIARIALGFNCRVFAADYFENTALLEYAKKEKKFVKYVSLEQVYRHSDIIFAQPPLTTRTNKMIDASAFRAMHRNTIFISNADPAVIDFTSFLRAMHKWRLRAAAINYTADEELIYDFWHPACSSDSSSDRALTRPDAREMLQHLRDAPNTIWMRHMAMQCPGAREKVVEEIVKILVELMRPDLERYGGPIVERSASLGVFPVTA